MRDSWWGNGGGETEDGYDSTWAAAGRDIIWY